jgi:hypothetical protein
MRTLSFKCDLEWVTLLKDQKYLSEDLVTTNPRFLWNENEGVWFRPSGTVVSIVTGFPITILTTVYYGSYSGVFSE